MASSRDETRVFARLPNLDIAFVHRAGGNGEGEQVMLALRSAPALAARQDLVGANPALVWMRLSQAFYGAWLGYLAAVVTPSWLIRAE